MKNSGKPPNQIPPRQGAETWEGELLGGQNGGDGNGGGTGNGGSNTTL
jgi:hypothetical protein